MILHFGQLGKESKLGIYAKPCTAWQKADRGRARRKVAREGDRERAKEKNYGRVYFG